jgi:hypothetical protein
MLTLPIYNPITNTWIIPNNYNPNIIPETEETSSTTYIEVSNEEYYEKYCPDFIKRKYK